MPDRLDDDNGAGLFSQPPGFEHARPRVRRLFKFQVSRRPAISNVTAKTNLEAPVALVLNNIKSPKFTSEVTDVDYCAAECRYFSN